MPSAISMPFIRVYALSDFTHPYSSPPKLTLFYAILGQQNPKIKRMFIIPLMTGGSSNEIKLKLFLQKDVYKKKAGFLFLANTGPFRFLDSIWWPPNRI